MIRKMGPGKYRVEIDVRIGGKRHRPSKLIETELTGRQLKALQITIEAQLEDELRAKLGDKDKLLEFTLRDLYQWYIEKKNLQQRTKEWYADYMENRTIPWFEKRGKMKVQKIDYHDAVLFMEYLEKEKTATKKPLSQKTKKHYLTILHSLFKCYKETLERQHISVINPFHALTISCPKRTIQGKFYSPEQIKTQMEMLSDYENQTLFLMYILTILGGLRPAELRGLTWEKINWEKEEMLIDQNLIRTRELGAIIKPTKNEVPRTIPLIKFAMTLLSVHYENEKRKRKRMKITKPLEKMHLFTNDKGEPIYESYFRNEWKKFCTKKGVEYKSPYSLRHTTATLLAMKNIPKVNIQNQLGHLDPQTTDIYIHAVDEVQEEIKNTFEETLAPKQKFIAIK